MTKDKKIIIKKDIIKNKYEKQLWKNLSNLNKDEILKAIAKKLKIIK